MKLTDLLDFMSDDSDFDVLYRGKAVKYLNEAGKPSENSKFFAAGFEHGAHVIVHVEAYRGEGFEAAHEAWIDSLPAIADEEIVEAYAPKAGGDSFYDLTSDMFEAPKSEYGNAIYSGDAWDAYRAQRVAKAREMLAAADEKAREGTGDDYPELIEGYVTNSTGGVVSVGHYGWCEEADLDEIEIVRKSAETEAATA